MIKKIQNLYKEMKLFIITTAIVDISFLITEEEITWGNVGNTIFVFIFTIALFKGLKIVHSIFVIPIDSFKSEEDLTKLEKSSNPYRVTSYTESMMIIIGFMIALIPLLSFLSDLKKEVVTFTSYTGYANLATYLGLGFALIGIINTNISERIKERQNELRIQKQMKEFNQFILLSSKNQETMINILEEKELRSKQEMDDLKQLFLSSSKSQEAMINNLNESIKLINSDKKNTRLRKIRKTRKK